MAVEKMSSVVEHLYPYFWHKFRFPVGNGIESECGEFIKNLREAVWVHRIVSFRHWHPFVEMNLIPMTSSPEMYVSCLYFMVSTTIQPLPNRYEPFMTTCSLVTAVAAYIYDKGFHEFLDYSPSILMVFFEAFHEEVFQKFKIWDHLQEYLTSNNYSEAYGIVEEKTRRNPSADIIFQLDFVREISLKIHSKIPFSGHAAVYHQVFKVLERSEALGTIGTHSRSISEARTMAPTISEVRKTASTVSALRPQDSIHHEVLQVLKRYINAETASTGIDLSPIGVKPSSDSVKETISKGAGRPKTYEKKQKATSSESTKLKPIVLREFKEVVEVLKSPEKSEKAEKTRKESDTPIMNLRKSSIKPDASQSTTDSDEITCFGNKDYEAATEEAILSKSEVPLKADVKTPEHKQSTSIKTETEEIDSKQTLPGHSDEQSLKDNVQNYEMKDIEDGIPDKLDYELKAEIAKCEEIKSAIKETEETIFEQASSCQSDEPFKDDIQKLGKDEDSVPIESDLTYVPSNDDSQHLEGYEKEENYPGEVQHEETDQLDENIETKFKPKPKRKKRRGQSKQKEIDSEGNLQIPSKKEVAEALLHLMGNMLCSLRDVHDLLQIPRDF